MSGADTGGPYTRFHGLVDATLLNAAIRNGGPYVAGWVNPVEGFPAPYTVCLAIGKDIFEIGKARPKAGSEAEAIKPGLLQFEADGAAAWPPILTNPKASARYMLVSADGSWVPLPVETGQPPLVLDYRDERAFIDSVQSMSSRPREGSTIAFHARHFVEANADRPLIRAAALTVLSYRVLDGSWKEPSAAEYCIGESESVLDALWGIEREMEFRWFVSLSLAAFYLRIKSGDSKTGLNRLKQVFARRDLVSISAPQSTNVLKATFFLGIGTWQSGFHTEANEILLSAKDTFRTAAGKWRFENYYSPNELIVSAQLARACLVWLENAHHDETGTWRHPSYASAPKDLSEYACLGNPGAQFLREGLIQLGSNQQAKPSAYNSQK